MTYKDLCKEIAALGFESELEDSERTLFAVSRALMTLYTERPVFRTLTLHSYAPRPVQKIDGFRHTGGEEESFPYTARAYTFKTSGTGRFKIEENGKESEVSFDGDCVRHCGFLHGVGSLCFLGEFSFSVFDFAFFDELYGEQLEKIPDISEYTEYSLASLAEDYLSPADLPKNEKGEYIEGSSVTGATLRIPSDYSGRISLLYKTRPARLSGNPDEYIALPEGCEHLIALLCASYIWLDDDAEKAYYYMSLYKEAMAALKYYGRERIDRSYKSVDGWA